MALPSHIAWFTSRAEYRLTLRADNADQRLTQKGIDHGLVIAARCEAYGSKMDSLCDAKVRLMDAKSTPHVLLNEHNIKMKQDGQKRSAFDLLGLQHVDFKDILKIFPDKFDNVSRETITQLQIEATYSGYLDRQNAEIQNFRQDEATKIPVCLDYSQIHSLSNEIREKLTFTKPTTLAQAGRIPGVTPAAISAISVYLKKKAA